MSDRSSELTVRPATPHDAETIVRIYVDSWNSGFGTLVQSIEADAARIDRWRGALAESPPARWWVAERDGAIVGFVGIRPSRDPIDPTVGELDTIAVAPAAWRTGIGRALMSVALEWLRSDGYRSALLWTLRPYPRGESFYQATGWQLNGASRRGERQVRYDHDL